MDVVARSHPAFATTQPLDFPVSLGEAARLLINDPIYLCPRGDLWITRADAAPTAAVLRSAAKEQVHVLPDRVQYVHWSVTDAGALLPTLVVAGKANEMELVTATTRRPLSGAGGIHWNRALSWNDRIVAPTDTGVAIIDANSGSLDLHSLAESASGQPVRLLLDGRGLLAWIPATASSHGSRGAARFVDDRWQTLGPDAGWPDRIVELLPLLDGTAVQIFIDDDGRTQLGTAVLDADYSVDEPRIRELIGRLAADDQADRDTASAELSRYGPRIWPLLERLAPDQPAEAQLRIGQLMAARVAPRLGAFRPIGGDLRVICHLADGGVILYTQTGVEAPRQGSPEPEIRAPAWLSIRPGRPVQWLPAALVADASPERSRFAVAGDEWIITDDANGPRRFMGNHCKPLLRPGEREFSHLAGIDARGRWLFRSGADADSPSLVIDRFLPDPTPRLPVWLIEVPDGDVGWDGRGWPVMRRGGAWALMEDRWSPLQDGETVYTDQPTTAATTQSAPPLLWQDTDGTRFLGDGDRLIRIQPGGERIEWPLPPEARTTLNPVLIRGGENRLFWFDVGRVIRLKETPGGGEPFAIEAVFTRDIPNVDSPRRIWLDPAGRIVIAHEGNKLAILFPSGRIPAEIARMMPGDNAEGE